MRATTIWRAGLLAVGVALLGVIAPSTAQAQGSLGYALPETSLPVPWGSSQPEQGGFYTALEFLLYRQTNPMKNEVIAERGFFNVNNQQPAVGSHGGAVFIGSGEDALDTNQIRGPGSYQPGFKVGIGYKFSDESTITLSWMHLFQIRYQAVATAVPANFNTGADFANSFLTANVYNFPNAFAGTLDQQNGPNDANGNPTATYGIWDGASIMTISFVQRTEAYDLIWRKPIYENEDYRFSSLLGPRFFWIWENFKWRTTNFGFRGGDGPSADYSNIDSNRMYGYNVGCSQEWYIGNGFACQLDTNVSGFLNIVKERTTYEIGRFGDATQNKRARTDYTVVPEVDAKLSLMWYPTENVQLNFGYNFMAFFNTVGSERPVDFNYSSIDPKFNREMRFFDGLSAALCITF